MDVKCRSRWLARKLTHAVNEFLLKVVGQVVLLAEVYDSPAGYEQLLNSWATTELLEIDRVASFLKDVASWTFASGSEWPQMWTRGQSAPVPCLGLR